MNHICVFCGSHEGTRAGYREAAVALGGLIARRGWTLVYGGASVGLMGALADAALEGGGEVIGILPAALQDREIAHRSLTELRLVDSMHARKQAMADLADAFIALPGGIGTLEELCEMLTWSQLGLHHKPVGILNVEHYYDPLLALIDNAFRDGFIREKHRHRYLAEEDPARLLDRLAGHHPPAGPQVLQPGEG